MNNSQGVPEGFYKFMIGLVVVVMLVFIITVKEREPKHQTFTIDKQVPTLVYTRDERTGVCYASPRGNHPRESLTMVPCNEKVLDIIRLRKAGE